MKRIIIIACLLTMLVYASAQTTYMRIWKNGEMISQTDISRIDSVVFNGSLDLSLQAVDLGLTSGRKWASLNVGATTPFDYGYYFQWGCPTPVPNYSLPPYCHSNDSLFTKYCTNSNYGLVDSLITLESEDDAATLFLGDNWRTPTKEEVQELINECRTSYEKYDDVEGLRLTGPNKNSIFLPFNGTVGLSDTVEQKNEMALYWTSSLHEQNNTRAWIMYYPWHRLMLSVAYRNYGLGVRAVYDDGSAQQPDSYKLDSLTFPSVYIGVSDTSCYGTALDTLRGKNGVLYHVKSIKASVLLFSDGLSLNNDYEFVGTKNGGLVEAEGPMYWAPGWANGGLGTIFVTGWWNIQDTDGLLTQHLPTGKTNDNYIPNMQLYLTNMMAGDSTTAHDVNLANARQLGCEGANMTYYMYHNTAQGYPNDGYYASDLPVLFFTDGSFEVSSTQVPGSSFLITVTSHHLVAKPLLEQRVDDANAYHYGCYWHYDVTTGVYSWNDEDVHWGAPYTYDYNYNAGTSAPERKRGQFMEITNFGDIQTTRKIMDTLHKTPKDHKK